MEDLYTFATSQKVHDRLYEAVARSYTKIFTRTGIGKLTLRTFASGGAFSKYSHEFQCLSETGEDTIYVSKKKGIAINKEVMTKSVLSNLGVSKSELVERKAIEVGNIFTLGTRFSEALGLKSKKKDGTESPVIMGCYGIGPTRLMGTLAEVLSDKKGLIWPESVAPFKVHLLELKRGLGRGLYEKLAKAGVEVLYDDRDLTPGEKFNDADLLGLPWRLVVSEKTKNKVEIKKRTSKNTELISQNGVIQQFS
ncbi:MAG: prolyl-tRNA synthetase, partial [Candidatus Colwellbacteria bacterium]|nr:prolyl-tRNA synthetase [Candidatus Colwellbacteria bacterium]